MSSGFGTSGGEGRCHAFWQDLRKCMTEAAQPAVCAPMREDYLECLHHRKEVCGRLPNPDCASPLRL